MSRRSTLVLLVALAFGCEEAAGSQASVSAQPGGDAPAPERRGDGAAGGHGRGVRIGVYRAVPDLEPWELPEPDVMGKTLAEQRALMLRRMRVMHELDDSQLAALDAVLAKGKWTGQGNPDVVEHPLTRAQCLAKRAEAGAKDLRAPVCGAPLMAPLYDPATSGPEQAKVCIDRYEFPGMPCDYPVTWVSTIQAHELCQAMGKRLCDAHEWEGGCAGALRSPEVEYPFGMPREAMEGVHNSRREKVWAYGATKDHKRCATTSKKSSTCSAPGWKACGSNTFPAGSFPECKSSLGVYDQHGNAAEHMWLPRKASELSALGGQGIPEMKGSWFIFAQHEAHLDDCRWRAPGWHANEGKQHLNYHLGFRCCKDVGAASAAP